MKYSNKVKSFEDKIENNMDFITLRYIYRDKNYIKDFNQADDKKEIIVENYTYCIWSAIYWMEIATKHLDKNDFLNIKGNIEIMELYSYISSIDIIRDAVDRLHNIIINENTVPFCGESIIFDKNNLKNGDNKVFSHIRAAFGAHPVDLHGGKNNKRFSRYPMVEPYSDCNWTVRLYNLNDKEPIVFGFTIEQLKQYLDKRINYLNVILEKIDEEHELHIMRMKNIPIPIGKYFLLREQIDLLTMEEKNRFNRRGLFAIILKKIRFFYENETTNILNVEKVDKFRDRLFIILKEILNILQNMDIDKLNSNFEKEFSPPDELKDDVNNLYFKIQDKTILWGSERKRIIKHITRYINVDENMEDEEIYLLANTAFYLMNNKSDGC